MNLWVAALSFQRDMKTLFVVLILGVIAGTFGWQYYQRSQKPTIAERANALAERTKETAIQTKEAVVAQADEWQLTPDNIKDELGKTGRVVRSRTISVGERMDDARIVTVIKGKLVVEKNLSVLDIDVECHDGAVKLSGKVESTAQIGQAVILALQTSGVHDVISDLAVKT
jgi:osmotically-inducible protein OsmY